MSQGIVPTPVPTGGATALNQTTGARTLAGYTDYYTPEAGSGFERRKLLTGKKLIGLDFYLAKAGGEAKFMLVFDSAVDADPAAGAIPRFCVQIVPGTTASLEVDPNVPYLFVNGILITVSTDEIYAATASTQIVKWSSARTAT